MFIKKSKRIDQFFVPVAEIHPNPSLHVVAPSRTRFNLITCLFPQITLASSLKPVTDAIPWAPESGNFWYSEGLLKIAITAIVGLSYLSLHPSLFSVRVAGLTAYDFTSMGRSRIG